MPIVNRLFAVVAMVVFALVAGAQEKEIKHVPIKPTSPASGHDMFVSYCAVCHGKDGRGGGPAADALKTLPPDLTTLAQKNGGKFPAVHVSSVIRGEANLPAHGNKEMPVWGPLFWRVSGGHESEVAQRVTNITKFVESLQAK